MERFTKSIHDVFLLGNIYSSAKIKKGLIISLIFLLFFIVILIITLPNDWWRITIQLAIITSLILNIIRLRKKKPGFLGHEIGRKTSED